MDLSARSGKGGAGREPGTGATRVTWHHAPDLAQLEELWRSLPGGAVCLPFQAPAFLDSFFRKLAPGSCEAFGILAAHRQDEAGPCMLLPLIRYRKGPVRIASCPDLGVSDQNASVLSRALVNDGPEAARSVAADMIAAVPGADVVDIKKIPPLIGDVANPLFDQPQAAGEGEALVFDGDMMAAVTRNPTRSVYKKARSNFRKLQSDGVDLCLVADALERRDVLDTMIAQRDQRFRSLGRRNSLKQDNREDFYRDLAGQAGSDTPFQILALRREDEVVAAVAMLVNGANANGVLISIGAERWHRYSPGIVVLIRSLYWSLENGVQSYSFGPGLQAYKNRFGAMEQQTRRLVAPLNATGLAAVKALHVKQGARALIERLRSLRGTGS